MADQSPGQEPLPTPELPPSDTPILDPGVGVAVPGIVGEETIRALEQRLQWLESNTPQVRIGVITATVPTLTVELGASGASYVNVRVSGGSTFSVGDTVECLVFGNDLLVKGKIGGIDVRDWQPGDIKWTARATPDAGWLLCNGQTFSSTTYPELALVLGATTVPNLAGRVPVGVGGGIALGAVGGSATHTLGVSEIPSHTHDGSGLSAASGGSHSHSVSDPGHAHNLPAVALASPTAIGGGGSNLTVAGGSISWTDGALSNISIQSGGAHTHSISGSTGAQGGSGAHNNMQPYMGLNPFIKT